MISLIILCTGLTAQERTALNIVCDTQDIPIYIDGHLIGHTPLPGHVDVFSGWHTVSFFPDVSDSNIDTRKVSRDIIRLGTQDVLAEMGEVVNVTMNYKNLGQDVNTYYQSVRTGTFFGFSMVVVLLYIIFWVYV